MRILVIEDEAVLREGLVDLLRGAGHEVEAAGDGSSGGDRALDEDFDLLVLDLTLPGEDGLATCRRLRQQRPHLPVLMLTARAAEQQKVQGFDAGADDYVTKPFGARELLARVEALGRRARAIPADPELLEADGCRLDLGLLKGTRGGREFALTAREAAILRWLYRHRGRAVSRAELLESVWGVRADLETRTVDVTIANLRQKIESDPSRPALVVAVKGVGYAWGPP
jgi:DNA-binding response OmpR family regulator